ncbi:hypothetical protein Lser_V15G19514 [Lactuca serriola]
MASSSTSSIRKIFKYDVFLSFRGEDTRTNFVDHLYHALKQKSIHTYKDDEEIKKGENISDELIGSIEDSKFYIIVFSKRYASSSWCLNELVKIMECQKTNEHTAYPVFYDVEPSEVRKQEGAVADAFDKLKNREAAGIWREALKEASDLAGWELKNTADRHEAKFIRKIVEVVSLELRSISFNIDEKLVGMETRIKNLVPSLGIGCDDVRMIGIKGMGGGGKTTLARAVFDHISFHFEGTSFVENVREKASFSGLNSLQKQILSDVFNEDMRVSSVFEGKHMMKRRMPNSKVLVVLDDVDHIDQLEVLAGQLNWFKPGSVIIITTRDEQVLVAHRVKFIHDVNLLSYEEAICLFSKFAFGIDIPIQGYEELSRQVVRYAARLPLTIKVLGSFLCGKDELEWIDALERLKTIPETQTLKKLEISYISLEEDYKEMFLDVACIMKGWWKDDAIKALESRGFRARNGLRVLQQKSLITMYYDCLGMHDHIEEMGRNIVRRGHPDEPHNHSRLWVEDEIEEILANDFGTKATRCIQFHSKKFNPHIFIKGLRKMKELRFLSVVGDSSSDLEFSMAGSGFPNALRYVDWTNYPFSSLPTTFQANNLAALQMHESRIVQLWEGGESKVFKKLRFLDFSYSMLSTIDLGLTPNLETLTLHQCNDLIEFHMTAGCLKLTSVDIKGSRLSALDLRLAPNLEKLLLYECNDLEKLHVANECQKLTILKISHSKLRTLDLGMTPNLKKLHLNDCHKLVELHTPIGCLNKLVHVDLSGCLSFSSFFFHKYEYTSCSVYKSLEVGPSAELQLIAETIERCPLHPDNNLPKFRFKCFYEEYRTSFTRNLEMLLSVGICACTNLETFSQSIWGLRHLRKLELKGSFLETVKDLDQLDCLEELILSSTTIKHLPDSICMLKHLKSLQLIDCLLLERLPEDLDRLECLEDLTLSSTTIKHLPDSICMLKHLESLRLEFCWLLEKLPEGIGELESLEMLTLSSAKIKHLPDSICMLKRLTFLKLDNCFFLEKLPEELGRLEHLEYLHVRGTSIIHLPQSILLAKGLWFIGSRELLESCGFTSEIHGSLSDCYVQLSTGEISRDKFFKALSFCNRKETLKNLIKLNFKGLCGGDSC